MENRSSSLFKYFSFPCRRIKDSLIRVNEILSRRWNDRACNRLTRKSSWSLILFHAKTLCAERFLSPPPPSVRFLSGGGHRGNNGLIFQRFTTRAENYVETEDRRGSWVAPVFYCLNRRWSIPFSRVTHTTHLVPDIRYSSFLSPAADTVFQTPWRNTLRLVMLVHAFTTLPYGIVSRTWWRCRHER